MFDFGNGDAGEFFLPVFFEVGEPQVNGDSLLLLLMSESQPGISDNEAGKQLTRIILEKSRDKLCLLLGKRVIYKSLLAYLPSPFLCLMLVIFKFDFDEIEPCVRVVTKPHLVTVQFPLLMIKVEFEILVIEVEGLIMLKSLISDP